jgi:hypothetical protein
MIPVPISCHDKDSVSLTSYLLCLIESPFDEVCTFAFGVIFCEIADCTTLVTSEATFQALYG